MYFVVGRINMCISKNEQPDKDVPVATIGVTPSPPPSAHPILVVCHDIEAVASAYADRRISLDPSGLVVVPNPQNDSGDKSRKVRIGNTISNFCTKFCGCNDESNYPRTGNEKEGEFEECESVPIPESSSKSFSLKKLWAFTGPGFLMSIGYLDPGSIESDLQSGAAGKYQLLWVLLWSTMIGLLMQRLAARLGTVSGLHLAEACHQYYPTIARITLWLLAEIAVIGAEMQEVIGSAVAFYLLSNHTIPLWAGVILAVVQVFVLLILQKNRMRKLEAVFGVMIVVMAVSFGYEYAKVEPNQLDIVKGILIPNCQHCDKSALLQGVGMIGAVIMPHNLFLHSALVKSRNIDRSKPSQVKEANRYFFIEMSCALLVSVVINLFIVAVFANGTWDEQGISRKSNAEILKLCMKQDINRIDFYNMFPNDTTIFKPNIYTGGIFLGCQYGEIAMYIWAVGILAAGQSSTMTGAYAGQFIMEGFLHLKVPRWKRSLVTRFMVLIPPLVVAIFQEIDYLSRINDWLNCSMSLLLPFAILPLISMTSKEEVMGITFKNGKGMKIVSSVLVVFLISLNMYFINSTLADNLAKPMEWYVFVAILSFGVLYISLCTYLFSHAVMSMGTSSWSAETVMKLMVVVTVNILILVLVLVYFTAC